MSDWITILTFTYPHEAHLAKSKLESEGVEVELGDELTVQVHNFYSNAIGGVKLKVREADAKKATDLLKSIGYLKPEIESRNKFLLWIDNFTLKIPVIGKSILEIRIIVFFVIISILIIVPIAILTMPSALERLTQDSWCVDRLIYKGQELTPFTESNLNIHWLGSQNCTETMTFYESGLVDFPGINTMGVQCLWDVRNDSLLISEWSINNVDNVDDSFAEYYKKAQVIYIGEYALEITDNRIKLESKNVLINGRIYRSHF